MLIIYEGEQLLNEHKSTYIKIFYKLNIEVKATKAKVHQLVVGMYLERLMK